jgi:hypothetical protein
MAFTPTPAEKLMIAKMREAQAEGYFNHVALERVSKQLGLSRERVLRAWIMHLATT